MRETWVRSLGWEDPLEKEMATHSSILAWKTPWTEGPRRLQSMGSQRVRHDWTISLSLVEKYNWHNQKTLLGNIVSRLGWLHCLARLSDLIVSRCPVTSLHLQACVVRSCYQSLTRLCELRCCLLSCVGLFAIPWTVAHQALPYMGFSRQEYWSGLPFPPPKESSPPRD